MNYPPIVILRSTLLATGLVLGGCGSVNITRTRETPAATAHPKQTQVNDLLTDVFVHCRELRMFRSDSGFMQLQIDVANDDFRQRDFAWRVDWLDGDGNLIESPMSVWKSCSIPAGGVSTLTSVAPSTTGVDFRLQVRRSN